MKTRFVEVTQSKERGPNHGKFMVGLFEVEEARRPSAIVPRSLMYACGWGGGHMLVFDLQTGEGAFFNPRGIASVDLAAKQVWVCPMFEPFLVWLYDHVHKHVSEELLDAFPPRWFQALPALVELPDVPFAMHGYRREGR